MKGIAGEESLYIVCVCLNFREKLFDTLDHRHYMLVHAVTGTVWHTYCLISLWMKWVFS